MNINGSVGLAYPASGCMSRAYVAPASKFHDARVVAADEGATRTAAKRRTRSVVDAILRGYNTGGEGAGR